jgi:hypothetical protein
MSIAHFVFFICCNVSFVAGILFSPIVKESFSVSYTPRRVVLTTLANATLASFIGPYVIDLELSLGTMAAGFVLGTLTSVVLVTYLRKLKREEEAYRANLRRIVNQFHQ